MPLIRRCLALILTLAVILSGAQSAVARSEMAAAVYPVLCGQDGASTAFDVTGRPITARHACPHCLAAGSPALALAPVPLAQPAPWSPAAARRLALLPSPLLRSAPAWHRPAATGPPARI